MPKKRKNGKGHGKASKASSGSSEESNGDSRLISRKQKRRQNQSNYNDDDYTLRGSLEEDGLEIVDMTADGNCLFRSISDQLYWDYGNNHEEIRSDICDYMEANEDDFGVFLVLDDDDAEDGEDAEDFESYIREMRMDGEWGGNLELVAAARLYGRDIHVFSTITLDSSAIVIEHGDGESSGPDLMVSFHDNNHYNSVRDSKAKPPKQKPTKALNRNLSGSSSRDSTLNESDKTSSDVTSSTTVSSSLSELSVDERPDPATKQPEENAKSVKKNDPCPCGSGKRYKKCCLAKEKHAARLRKLKEKAGEVSEGEEEVEKEVAMKGNFRVVRY